MRQTNLNKFRLMIAAIMSLCVMSSAFAKEKEETTSVGDLIFTTTDWSVTGADAAQAILTHSGKGSVVVSRPTRYIGDRRTAFHNTARLLHPTKNMKNWAVHEAVTTSGYDVFYSSPPEKQSGVRRQLLTLAVFHEGKITMMTLFAEQYAGDERLIQNFGGLLSSLQVGDKPLRKRKRSKSERIDGFFASLNNEAQHLKGIWLQKDGSYAETVTGVSDSFKSYCKKHAQHCGQYEIADGQYKTMRVATQLEAVLGLNRVETFSFALEGGDLMLGKTRYANVAPLSELRLDGNYRSQVSQNTYGFLRDGSFIEGGDLTKFRSNNDPRRDNKNSPRTGRYEIDDYQLTLTYGDGESDAKAFFMIDDRPIIDGVIYGKM